jgi:hypothetical protein
LWTANCATAIFKDNLLKMNGTRWWVRGVPDVWFQGRFLREMDRRRNVA